MEEDLSPVQFVVALLSYRGVCGKVQGKIMEEIVEEIQEEIVEEIMRSRVCQPLAQRL